MTAKDRLNEPLISELLELQQWTTELKVSEIRSKKAGKLFRILFNSSPIGIYIVEDGKFQFVNPQFQKLTGYSKDELLGIMNPLRLVFPKDRNMVKENAAKMLKGELTSPYEYRFVKKDGEIRWAMETVTSIQNDRRRIILGYFMDVTKNKQAEKELRESEERYRLIVETANEGIWIIDAESRTVFANIKMAEMLGFTRNEMIGKSLFEFMDEEGQTIAGKSGSYEVSALHKDGRNLILKINTSAIIEDGKITGGMVLAEDITERKLAEKTLRKSEERYRTIFETTGTATIIIEEDTTISLANTEFERLSGYSKEELEGKKSWTDFVEKDDLERMKEYHRMRRTDPNAAPRNYEYRFIDRQGNVRDVFVTIAMVPGTKKSVASLLDITERKRTEKDITRLDRLHLVGQMAAGIGHEIRNPMTTIRGFLQMLGSKKECTQYHEYFVLMIEELDRANSIITEFLSMARNNPVEMKRQNFNSIAKALSPLITADAMNSNKNVIVELGDIPDLLLNEKEVRQLILNLVRNGLEAMSPGGYLAIKTFIDAGEVVLSVQDQGKGIDPSMLDKLGTPFFTTKETGTGLGLAISYSIAARHNATINVETGDTGTTFFVRFGKQGLH